MNLFTDWLANMRCLFGTEKPPTLAYLKNGEQPTSREVAFAYMFGDSVKQNFRKSLRWFRKTRSENYFFIGACYYALNHHRMAVRYFKKEIDKESYGCKMAMAARALAECYQKGIGVPKNETKGVEYNVVEGEIGGTARDAYWMGICTLYGLGLVKNTEEGLRLLDVAVRQGEDWACLRLGKIYLYGEFGLEKNVDKAIEYLTQSKDMKELTSYYLEQAQNSKKP